MRKICDKSVIKDPTIPKRVATLPCVLYIFKNCTNRSVHKLWKMWSW